MKRLIKPDTFKPLKELIFKFRKKVSKYAPEILTGMGVAGLCTTTIMVAKAAPKAKEALEEAEDTKGDTLTFKEKVIVAGPIYAPSIVSGVITSGCIVGSNAKSREKYGKLEGRYGTLMGAYTVSETLVKAYGDKVIEVLGEDEANKIREKAEDDAAEEKMKAHPPKNNEVMITEFGTELCYDAKSDRYFMSNYHSLVEHQDELITREGPSGFITVNEWYREIDLKPMPGGDDYGWDMMSNPFSIRLSTKIAEDKRACLVVFFTNPPRDMNGREWR